MQVQRNRWSETGTGQVALRTPSLSFIVLTLCVLTLAPGRVVAASDESLQELYFDSMRGLGLFVIAEDYATARLTQSDLNPAEKTALTIELARTLVLHSILDAGSSAEQLRQEAKSLLTSPDAGLPASERFKLAIWDTLLQSSIAISEARLLTLQPEKTKRRENARQQLLAASRDLKAVLERLQTGQPEERALPPSDSNRLRQLAAYSCGEALLCLSELSAGADTTRSLVEARRAIDFAAHGKQLPAWTRKVDLLQARLARFQNDLTTATRRLEQASSGDAGLPEKDDVTAEQIRLRLAEKKYDAAMELAVERLRQSVPPTDDLRLAAIEALLDSARFAKSKEDLPTKDALMKEAQHQLSFTGGFPHLLAHLLVSRFEQEMELGADLATLVRQGEAAWEDGESEHAAELYGRSSILADQKGLAEPSFQFAFTQASILLQSKEWEKAEGVLSGLLGKFPEHARAAEMDLLRCFAIGQRAPHSKEFVNAARLHVERFRTSPTLGDALFMLAGEAEYQQDLRGAIEYYRRVPADDVRSDESRLRTLFLVEQLLLSADQQGSNRTEIQQLAGEEMRRIVPSLLKDVTLLTLQQSQTLLCSVRICLLLKPPLITEAIHILDAVQERVEHEQAQLANQLGPGEAWQSLEPGILQLRIFALATADRFDEAGTFLRKMQETDPASLITALSKLSEFADRMGEDQQKQLGTLQRLLVQEISQHREKLTPEQVELLERAAIQASVALKDWPAGIHQIETLLNRGTTDPSLTRLLIDLSMKQGEPADLIRARKLWLQIEQQEKKGSPRWIEARVNLAELMERTGDTVDARKILGVTRTLYPTMSNSDLKSRADALWDRLK